MPQVLNQDYLRKIYEESHTLETAEEVKHISDILKHTVAPSVDQPQELSGERECRGLADWALADIANAIGSGFRFAHDLDGCPIPQAIECPPEGNICECTLEKPAPLTCNWRYVHRHLSHIAAMRFQKNIAFRGCRPGTKLFCALNAAGSYHCRTVAHFEPLSYVNVVTTWAPITVGLLLLGLLFALLCGAWRGDGKLQAANPPRNSPCEPGTDWRGRPLALGIPYLDRWDLAALGHVGGRGSVHRAPPGEAAPPRRNVEWDHDL